MICRYDTQAKAHLIDGEPCQRDEHGNPVRHDPTLQGGANDLPSLW